MRWLADVTAKNVEPVRIALAHQHRGHVQRLRRPEIPATTGANPFQSPGRRAVQDCERPRRAAHEDRLSECHMQRHFVAFDFFGSGHGDTNFPRSRRTDTLTSQRRHQNQRRSRRSWWP